MTPIFPTGATLLDATLHGGLPNGVCEVYGGPSTGKSALSLSLARETARRGLGVVHIFVDGLPDKPYWLASAPHDMTLVLPTTGESAFKAACGAFREGASLVIIDSATNLEPEIEYRCRMGIRVPRAQLLMVERGLYDVRQTLRSHEGLLVLVSQLRRRLQAPVKSLESSLDEVTRRSCAARIRMERVAYRTAFGDYDYLKSSTKITQATSCPPGGTASVMFFKGGVDWGFEMMRYLLHKGLLVMRGSSIQDRYGNTLGSGYKDCARNINTLREEGKWKFELR